MFELDCTAHPGTDPNLDPLARFRAHEWYVVPEEQVFRSESRDWQTTYRCRHPDCTARLTCTYSPEPPPEILALLPEAPYGHHWYQITGGPHWFHLRPDFYRGQSSYYIAGSFQLF